METLHKALFVFFTMLGMMGDALTAEPLPPRAHRWETSRVKGSPDPPLPYIAQPVFQNVELDRPTDIQWLPSANCWIASHSGNKIVKFQNDQQRSTAEQILNLNLLSDEKVQVGYATKFHTDQNQNTWCYLTLTTKRKSDDGHRLVRLRVVDPSVPSFDPSSLTTLASWKSNGHVGSSMQFGADGMLYVSVGDGQPPYPPDGEAVGQDLSSLRSTILRLDVNHPTEDEPYKIPTDNPFVGKPNARGEIWAFGFRNPWKISFAPNGKDLFVADVGWEMREMIHLVRRGQNHGWSIMEGSQQVKPDEQPSIPITPPLHEHSHLDSRSITGGYFWQSDRIPKLKDTYIYGDWMTGKVWGLRYDGQKVTWQKELVDTPHQIICFMRDPSGEVLIVGYDGTILRLQPSRANEAKQTFPTKLSQTGLFRDTAKQIPAKGVEEYRINAHRWADNTRSRQWIALPDATQLKRFSKTDWTTGQSEGRFEFPVNSVAAKTVSYLTDSQDPKTETYLETQILHKEGDEWKAYNYIWNDEQTDALLQDDVAIERKLIIKDLNAKNGERLQTWRHASRSECLLCHVWSAGTVQGFWPPQLNLNHGEFNQLDQLTDLGLFAEPIPKTEFIVDPHDEKASLEQRARSYLSMNCSTCHRKLGGGTATFTFDITVPADESNYINAQPSQGSFGLNDARVVASGNPEKSVLFYRFLKSGRGHMPQFGSHLVDHSGIAVLHDWIATMQTDHANPMTPLLDERAVSLNGYSDEQIKNMLTDLPAAITLSAACSSDRLTDELRSKIIAWGNQSQEATIRELFEHHLPESERVQRLGPTIDELELLATKGSIAAGERLFKSDNSVTCRACHKIGDVGKAMGPDLNSIGLLQTPREILASIVRPSENISKQFLTQQVLTDDGQIITGILVDETPTEIHIAEPNGQTIVVKKDEIEVRKSLPKSAMPEQLLSGMTMQQAADLLAYLAAQRKPTARHHRHSKIHHIDGPIIIDGQVEEEAWAAATKLDNFAFTWWKDGDPPQQTTEARLLWDDQYLYLAFTCKDANILAKRRGRDSKVYRDDCVEIFASPDFSNPQNYFNLEMNVLGEQLDQYRPQGKLIGKWNPEGIKIATQIHGTLNQPLDIDEGWTLEAAIPFKLFPETLPNGKPKVGDRWRLNLSRLEDEMLLKSQWSQGDRNFPRFHHPEYFGSVEFSNALAEAE